MNTLCLQVMEETFGMRRGEVAGHTRSVMVILSIEFEETIALSVLFVVKHNRFSS